MDAIETLRMDVQEGRISADRLCSLVVIQQQQLEATQQQLEATQHQLESANKRIDELEKKLGGCGTAKVDEAFSMRAEEKRQEARGEEEGQEKEEGPQGALQERGQDRPGGADRADLSRRG